jgi:hypothetical protein
MGHFIRVLLAIALSGAGGWVFLFGYNVYRIAQQFETFEAAAQGQVFVDERLGREFGVLLSVLDAAVRSVEGSSALFLATGIAGVLLGEVFKTYSLLFYAASTGALTAILAAALWQQAHAAGNAQTAAVLAVAGFVAGTVYWMIAGYTEQRRRRAEG